MSGKLDQSLDEIMKDSNTTRGPRRGRNGRLPGRKAAAKSKAATAAVVAPAGGVQKKTKPAKPAKAPAAAAVIPKTTGESKISVSNLPEDVTENLIKDFFSSSVAPVKRVMLNYGPQGRSRGSATVSFAKPTAAAEAVKYDGTKVDGRSMRIEVLVGAKSIPAPQPPKPLKDRLQPKSVVKEGEKKKQQKETPKAAANGAAKGGRPKKPARQGRPKKKTAEELDAEMQDYFGGGEAAVTNGAPAANGGDTGMEEVI